MGKPKADPLEQAARDVRRRMAAADSLLDDAGERLPPDVLKETRAVRHGLSLAFADIQRAQRKAKKERTR